MSDKCIFCEEINTNSEDIFYKDEKGLFVAHWDQFPSTPGHAEVLPVRHFANFSELNDAERSQLATAVNEVTKIISKTNLALLYERMALSPKNDTALELIQDALVMAKKLNRPPDAFNHGLNDGTAAGRTISHMHYHLMPRWEGDVDDPRGGVRHIFPKGGNYRLGEKNG